MSTAEELGQKILKMLADIDCVADTKVSAHFGQGVVVLMLNSKNPMPVGEDGSNANAKELGCLIRNYRLAIKDPVKIEEIKAGIKLGRQIDEMERQRQKLLYEVGWDLQALVAEQMDRDQDGPSAP